MLNKTILIIDDEQDLCELFTMYLQPKGYTVYTANNIDVGRKSIASISPDILFIDNNLPDGLGWKFAVELSETHRNLKIICMSAFDYDIDTTNSHKLKIIEKPIKLSDIDEAIGARH